MLTAFAQAFKTPDLRKKLLFVLAILVLFRIGSSIPAPGVSVKNINYCLKFETANGGDIYTLSQHLRHSSVKTTEIYLDFLTPEEAEAAKRGGRKALDAEAAIGEETASVRPARA